MHLELSVPLRVPLQGLCVRLRLLVHTAAPHTWPASPARHRLLGHALRVPPALGGLRRAGSASGPHAHRCHALRPSPMVRTALSPRTPAAGRCGAAPAPETPAAGGLGQEPSVVTWPQCCAVERTISSPCTSWSPWSASLPALVGSGQVDAALARCCYAVHCARQPGRLAPDGDCARLTGLLHRRLCILLLVLPGLAAHPAPSRRPAAGALTTVAYGD